MSTINKTNFGQINLSAIIASVGSEWLGHGKRASRCNNMDGERWDLQEMIQSTHFTYAWRLKIAWDVKNWDQESIKTSQTQEFTYVLDFHESRMIHGR
jgi:hypothetical protein